MNTARLLVPIFILQEFLYLLLDFLLAGYSLNYNEILENKMSTLFRQHQFPSPKGNETGH